MPRMNGKIKVKVENTDGSETEKTFKGGTKISEVIPSGTTAVLTPKGGTAQQADPNVRDVELRDGDFIQLVRKSAKAGL